MQYDSVVTSVIEKFKHRADVGLKKYGTTLDRTDLSASDWAQHLQEELMDGILYLERLKRELPFTAISSKENKRKIVIYGPNFVVTIVACSDDLFYVKYPPAHSKKFELDLKNKNKNDEVYMRMQLTNVMPPTNEWGNQIYIYFYVACIKFLYSHPQVVWKDNTQILHVKWEKYNFYCNDTQIDGPFLDYLEKHIF